MESLITISRYLRSRFRSNEFAQLRNLIEIPDVLLELPRVLSNAKLFLPKLKSVSCHYKGSATTLNPAWIESCLKVTSHQKWPEWSKTLTKSGIKPLTGFYKTHPFYVTLWTQPSGPLAQEKYYLLLAHISLASASLIKNIDNKDKVQNSIRSSLTVLRSMAKAEDSDKLEKLPNLNVPPQELLYALMNAEKYRSTYEAFTPLLNYYLDYRKPHSRSAPLTRYLKNPARLECSQANNDPSSEVAPNLIEILKIPTLEKEQVDTHESEGCIANEDDSGIEIAVSSTYRKSPITLQQKASYGKKASNQLTQRNQLLPCRWERLSLFEVSAFLTSLSDLVGRKKKSYYALPNIDVEELTAVMLTIFWRSLRLEQLVEQEYYQQPISAKYTPSIAGYVKTSGACGHWLVKPALPSRKLKLEDSQAEQALPLQDCYEIQSGIGVERYIDIYAEKKNGKLFPAPLKWYEKISSTFLSKVNHIHNTRLTVPRIGDYIYDNISRREGSDLTTAMYLTGRQHFLGVNPSYYTAIKVSRLQNVYHEVCLDIQNQHFNERGKPPQIYVYEPFPETTNFVGSPLVPKQETVQHLVNVLRAKLVSLQTENPSILKLMRLHNSMTRYTSYLVNFCTGFRAVRDPFLSAAEIDWQTGFSILTDKDNEDGYNSRLIWIPPLALTQLKLFREHLNNAMDRFSLLIPDFHRKLLSPRRTGPGRHMFFAINGDEPKSYEMIVAAPTKMNRHIEKIYALPYNSSRHYLRSNLLNTGCPTEVISAFMGHWERGEEPWGTYSGMSPISYRDSLIKHLTPILEAAGWEPIAGLGPKL